MYTVYLINIHTKRVVRAVVPRRFFHKRAKDVSDDCVPMQWACGAVCIPMSRTMHLKNTRQQAIEAERALHRSPGSAIEHAEVAPGTPRPTGESRIPHTQHCTQTDKTPLECLAGLAHKNNKIEHKNCLMSSKQRNETIRQKTQRDSYKYSVSHSHTQIWVQAPYPHGLLQNSKINKSISAKKYHTMHSH